MRIFNFHRELQHFRDLFTRPTYDSLKQLTPAVIACQKARKVTNLHESVPKDERKSRTAYEYFFNGAEWDDLEVALRKAEVFYSAAKLRRAGKLFLTIDDTLEEKRAEKTEGVGSFYDHARKDFVWGNNFVTSALQVGEVYMPHIARMYLKASEAQEQGKRFRTKFEIAYEDIIATLRVPEFASVYVLFDSWWYSKEFIIGILALGYHAVGQLKSNSLAALPGGRVLSVSELAKNLKGRDFKRVSAAVRGRIKHYRVHECIAALEGIGEVKLVISLEGDESPVFLFCTDAELTAKEIISAYENRWNIETAHKEANQKLGFKDYQMRDRRSIERFMQVVFLAWAIMLIAKLRSSRDFEGIAAEMRLGELLNGARVLMHAMLFVKLCIFMEREDAPSVEEVLKALEKLTGR